MDLTVVICTYNRERFLADTLVSMARQTLPPDHWELLLIDNNSSDRTPDIARAFVAAHPEVRFRYVHEPTQGLSHARNRGIAEAAGDVVVFLDDDIWADAELLAHYAAAFSDPDLDAAGGRILVRYEGPRPAWMSPWLEPLMGYHDLGPAPRTYPGSKYPGGGNMAMRKAVFGRVGLFNTELGRKGTGLSGNEEKDLFQRLRAMGGTVRYLPNASLYHRIDERRLEPTYFKRQCVGVGTGERVRLQGAGWGAWLGKAAEEGFKTGASLVLASGYLLTGSPVKGAMLLRFRWWVWTGLTVSDR